MMKRTQTSKRGPASLNSSKAPTSTFWSGVATKLHITMISGFQNTALAISVGSTTIPTQATLSLQPQETALKALWMSHHGQKAQGRSAWAGSTKSPSSLREASTPISNSSGRRPRRAMSRACSSGPTTSSSKLRSSPYKYAYLATSAQLSG